MRTMEPIDLLQEENRRLKSLTESFYLLNSSLDLQTVLHNTLTQATELMNAETGSIALLNDERTHLVFVESTDKKFSLLKQLRVPITEGIAGAVAMSGRSERIADIRNDPRYYGKVDQTLGRATYSYLCVPLIVNGEIIGTAQLLNRRDGQVFTREDERLMEGFARQASLAIQNARMHAIMLKQKAIESELSVCSEIQQKLFPDAPPQLPGYEIYGESTPCREVGGDYYGYYKRPDGTIDFIVADVSGKGLSAALLVSEFHTGIRMLDALSDDLATAVNILNRHLVETIVIGRFIGIFLLRLFPDTGRAQYILAGTPPPYLYKADGSVLELETTGPVLGLKGANYRANEIEIGRGDLLLAVSDGYTEAMNPADDLFGEDRLKAIGVEWFRSPVSQIAVETNHLVDAFREGRAANDDATMMIIRRLP